MTTRRNSDKPSRLHHLLRRSQAIAEKLIKQNEQLKLQLAAAEERCRAAETERDALRARMGQATAESVSSLEELQTIETELNTLANLHSANWQLHARLDLQQVLNATLEICLNLVGAERVVVYLLDEEQQVLIPVRRHGVSEVSNLKVDDGTVGNAVRTGEVLVPEQGDCVAVVPFAYEGRVVGAVVISALLPHKAGIEPLDHQLFQLMSRQGATALYGAYLAGVSAHKITEEGVQTYRST